MLDKSNIMILECIANKESVLSPSILESEGRGDVCPWGPAPVFPNLIWEKEKQ